MATPTPRPVPISSSTTKIATTTPKMRQSRIASIRRGRLKTPLRHLFYGPEGVGKSSLAADAPNTVFFDVEGGSPELDVARYPFRDGSDGHVPRSYEEVLAAIDDLTANPGHGYESLAVDTIDALETLIHRFICERDQKSGIEAYGFGKGYRVALDEVRQLLSRLDALRASGMQIIMLGHSMVSTFKDPQGPDYDRYELRVDKRAAGQIKEWCDVVGFVQYEGGGSVLKDDQSQAKRARGWSTGRRMVYLGREAAWDAKSRLALPAELELDRTHPWRPFGNAKEIARDSTLDTMSVDGGLELARITGVPVEDSTTDLEFITSSGAKATRLGILKLLSDEDTGVLSRVLAGLKSTQSVTSTQETTP